MYFMNKECAKVTAQQFNKHQDKHVSRKHVLVETGKWAMINEKLMGM